MKYIVYGFLLVSSIWILLGCDKDTGGGGIPTPSPVPTAIPVPGPTNPPETHF
jgi:hypothetical protein